MKQGLSNIGLAALKGSIEVLMFLPLMLIIGVYLLPSHVTMWLWFATVPLLYAAGCLANTFLPLNKWVRLFSVVTVLGAVSAYLITGQSYSFFVVVPFTLLFVYRGAHMAQAAWSLLFPVHFYLVGLLVYFIASVVLQYIPIFEPYVPVLTWLGLLALAITLLMTNQSTMKQETLSGDKEAVVASVVLRQNRVLVVMVLFFIILVVFFRKLQAALNWLKELLIAWLRELLNRPSEPQSVNQETAAPQPPMGLGEAAPPAAWLQWLEKAAMVIAGIALVIGVLFLLYIGAKKLPALFKRFFIWLIQLFNQRGQQRQKATGYEDDVESLMDWKGLNSKMAGRVKKWITKQFEQKLQWQAMDNRERVRFLYRQWLRKHAKEGYQPQKHLTPNETSNDIGRWAKGREAASEGALPVDSLIKLYEQARYSSGIPEEADVEALKKTFENQNSKKQS
jgi:hypothetical protein